jgi:hypothetical protein
VENVEVSEPSLHVDANRGVSGTTGVLVTDKAGAWIIVSLHAPPLAVKATWASVIRAVEDASSDA